MHGVEMTYQDMLGRGFLVAALLAVVGGCSVGPNYVKPTAPVPPAYKESQGWKPAEPREELPRGAWWKVFNDVKLDGLEAQVDVSNQNIAVAVAQLQQAQAVVRASQSGYFPTVTAGLSYTRAHLGPGGSNSIYLLNGDMSWEPDIWGKVSRTVEANGSTAQANAALLESVRLSTYAAVAQDYFLLCSLDSDERILTHAVDDYQKFLQLTKNRFASGVVSKADILQAETLLTSTQAQAIELGVQRAQLEHAIALLLGKPASEFSIPVTSLVLAPPRIPIGLPSELLERRPDIAEAERNVQAANAQIGIAKTAYFPTLTISATGTFQGSNLSNWFSSPNPLWAIGPGLLETVFDAGLRRAQTDEARAGYESSVANYRQTVLNAFLEVEDNLAALRILAQEAGVQDQAVNAAVGAVALTTNQYKAGTASALDVIVLEVTELNTKRTAVDILARRMNACVLLIKALGGGWDVSELPPLPGEKGAGSVPSK